MKTTEEYIKQAEHVHGEKYDYSKVKYIGSKNKVCIICPEHGEFWQEANSHLKGCGCPECNGTFSLGKEKFVKKAKSVHGNKYDYSKVVYVNNHTPVSLICHNHGEFSINPNNHLQGGGCPCCSNVKRYATDEYVEKAKRVYGDLYDLSKIRYVNARTKVVIGCKKHGEVNVKTTDFLQGKGCPKCGREKNSKTLDNFIEDSRKIHGDKYDYSKVEYINNKTKVCIICPEHGNFEMTPNSHLLGQGCPKCGYELNASKKRIGKEKTIEKFKKKFGDLYDYSLWNEEYKNIEAEIPIICKEHGIFKKTIQKHLQGEGCPVCRISKLENSIRMFLLKNRIDFTRQKTFPWLKYKSNMFLDFYLPEYNVAIECQGGQHYAPFEIFGGEKEFEKIIKRDDAKKKLCEQHGIIILYYSTTKYVEDIITNKKQLLKEIKKYG